MTDRPPIRASDQERETVVAVLRDAFTDGRLTFDEFEERTAAAYAARTWIQLGELTADLPAHADLSQRLQEPPPQDVPRAIPPRRARRERPFDRVLPVLFVWILIAAAAGAPSLAAALSFIFICVLATRIGYGGRRW
ncbi:MAG TPA: DUF1707 domain-containing protein [Streptosporangiaceae bacterium]|nr:DUF1707 domain-containing protein [Streptosporangiaceae bacterium]